MSDLTLLPLTPRQLASAKEKLVVFQDAEAYSPKEADLALERSFSSWLDEEEGELSEHVQILLDEAAWFNELHETRDPRAGKLYQRLVLELASFGKVKRRTAAISVSYLPLIIRLVKEFQCSSAAVAKMLNESDRRLLLHWRGIEKMLTVLKLRKNLQLADVKCLLVEDRDYMSEEYGDADLATINEIVCHEASAFEMGVEFSNSFSSLILPEDKEIFVPYLQVLYNMCVVAAFSDHPLEYLYTFKPRGKVSDFCLKIFPSEMAPGGNAFLNNFKAVDKLSMDWARSRDDAPAQAEALVSLILGLSQLSYGSRKYLARHIRAALLRLIEIKCPERIELLEIQSVDQVKASLERLCCKETCTKGIIEQRVCDFLSLIMFCGSNWRTRGIGDPVNATNTSSRKLGDADFQNATRRRCVAVEAHAGKLTSVYVREHLRTLEQNLPSRIGEWEGIADLNEWGLEVVFVVHEDGTSGSVPWKSKKILPDFRIETYQSFTDQAFTATKLTEKALVKAFNQHVVKALSKDNIPHVVKQKARELLSE